MIVQSTELDWFSALVSSTVRRLQDPEEPREPV